MIAKRIALKNWRNFRALDVPLRETTYLIGPNAVGKSNLLDAFRFLRDVCKPKGGGLQAAVENRDGLSSLRCLHARRDPGIEIEIDLAVNADAPYSWRYILGFSSDPDTKKRALITKEEVWREGGRDPILLRPSDPDRGDAELLTQSHLEQIQTNREFRELAAFLSQTTYQHLVTQLLRDGEKIGGRVLEDDPYGQGFLAQLASMTPVARDRRLARVGESLKLAVPQFEELKYKPRGNVPHLEARYKHHRPHAGWQSEEHFSDGTLRLLGLLWVLLGGDSLLLLEEPELSLNDAIVRKIPLMLKRAQQGKKGRRQVLVSTHSEALLSNPGIDPRGIILLEPGTDGSTARLADEAERTALSTGLSAAEVLLPKTRPQSVEQLALFT